MNMNTTAYENELTIDELDAVSGGFINQINQIMNSGGSSGTITGVGVSAGGTVNVGKDAVCPLESPFWTSI
jgi:bacteriocin-like protein